jgi:hypothetical protein
MLEVVLIILTLPGSIQLIPVMLNQWIVNTKN